MRQRLSYKPLVPAFYWGATYALRGILWVVGRWVVRGRENVPAEGPLLVVSNHRNNADPPILGAGLARRRIRFMAKIELYKFPFGIIPRLYGAFPVRRFDADIGALMQAERILRDGGVIGMFPEGTRSRTGRLGQPHPGTALIALRSGAQVLPCAITGTERLKNPLVVLAKPRITVTIGEPIVFERVKRPTEEQIAEATDRIFRAIVALLPASDADGFYTEKEAQEAETAHGSDPPGE